MPEVTRAKLLAENGELRQSLTRAKAKAAREAAARQRLKPSDGTV